MRKIKITYIDYGTIKAKIINSYGFYSVGSEIINNGIQEHQVLKIEIVLEAIAENTIDQTV